MSNRQSAERSVSPKELQHPASATCEQADAMYAAQLCRDWLLQEADFHTEFAEWLRDLTKQSPFASGPDRGLIRRLERLSVHRDDIAQLQVHCRTVLADVSHCSVAETRLSSLEAMLPVAQGAELRELRLRTSSHLAMTQRLLRSAETRLTLHDLCLGDILGQLLGTSPSTSGYGADGRQSASHSLSHLQAVS